MVITYFLEIPKGYGLEGDLGMWKTRLFCVEIVGAGQSHACSDVGGLASRGLGGKVACGRSIRG